jgi:hypothetical protein
VGNVSQDLDAWLVSHVEQLSRASESTDLDPESEKTADDGPVVIQPARKLSSEPEPEVRFCDEVTIVSTRHRAKSHFRAMLASAVVLTVGLAAVAGYEIDHKLGASPASFEVPTVVLHSGLGIQGVYIANPPGQLPVMMSLRQDGRDLHGTMTTPVLDQATSPRTVETESIVVTGFVDRSNVEIFFHAKTMTSYEGTTTATSMTFQISGSPVVFNKQTLATFDSLVSRDSAYVLHVSDQPSDNLAKWNLVTAIAKAKELAFVSKGNLSSLGNFGDFTTHLEWTTGSCATSACVSYALTDNDRGVALATYSPASASCWYAEFLPRKATSFAKSAKPGTCSAASALSAKKVSWSPNLAQPGVLG